MPKEEQEQAILMIFPLSAFPASNYLQLRGFPDLMLLAEGKKGIVELNVASLIYWLVSAGFNLKLNVPKAALLNVSGLQLPGDQRSAAGQARDYAALVFYQAWPVEHLRSTKALF